MLNKNDIISDKITERFFSTMSLEQFRLRLQKTHELAGRGLAKAKGLEITDILEWRLELERHLKETDKRVKPKTPGHGTTGEASIRATRGGLF